METIEIGAVILDEDNREIASFREYIRPDYSVDIRPRIQKLTGITWDMVEEAGSFSEVLERFVRWCGPQDYTIYSWSDSDIVQILQETELKGVTDTEELLYMYHHWKDFQQEYCGLFPMDHVMSLEKAMNYCGLDFQGRQHDGLNDARATADMFRLIRDKDALAGFEDAVLSYFKPTTFTLADALDLSAFAALVENR